MIAASLPAVGIDRLLLDGIRQAPIGVAIIDRSLRFLFVNDELAEMNGLSVADHLGRRAPEILPGLDHAAFEAMRRVLDTGTPIYEFEARGETAAWPGQFRYWREQFQPLRGSDGTVQAVAIFVREVTLERRAADRQRRLHAMAVALSGAIDPCTAGDAVLRESLVALHADGGLIVLLDDDGCHLAAIASAGDAGVIPPVRRQSIDEPGPLQDCVRGSEAIWLEGALAIRSRFAGRLDEAPAAAALAVLPLVVQDRPIGALVLSWGNPRRFDDETRRFIDSAVRLAAQSLARTTLYRTARATEALLREVVDRVAEPVTIRDIEGRVMLRNEAAGRREAKDAPGATDAGDRVRDEHGLVVGLVSVEAVPVGP